MDRTRLFLARALPIYQAWDRGRGGEHNTFQKLNKIGKKGKSQGTQGGGEGGTALSGSGAEKKKESTDAHQAGTGK